MSRVLLADDSPHAQRMGERILREEGFEVASVTDGETALIRLRDVDPDLILLDAFLPRRSGYDICKEIKQTASLNFTSVVLTYGLTEPIDSQKVTMSGADATLQKPFESGSLLELIRPLVELAQKRRKDGGVKLIQKEMPPAPLLPKEDPQAAAFPILQKAPSPPAPALATAGVKVTAETSADSASGLDKFDEERVRAAVTLALDAAMPKLIDELTSKVILALKEY